MRHDGGKSTSPVKSDSIMCFRISLITMILTPYCDEVFLESSSVLGLEVVGINSGGAVDFPLTISNLG